MKPTLDMEQADFLLDEILAEYGHDHVYDNQGDGCVYVRDGEWSCLIGVLLGKLGVSQKHFILPDGSGAADNHSSVSLILPDVVSTTPDVIHYLRTIQRHQDDGKPWGESVAFGRKCRAAGLAALA